MVSSRRGHLLQQILPKVLSTFQKKKISLTIWAERPLDLGTDLFASVNILEDDFFES